MLFELLESVGSAVLQPVIVPLLAWTVLALPLWWLVERTDRIHPYGKYRLLQLILAALPLGILATGLAELLPESTTIPTVTTPAVTVLPPIQSVDVTAGTSPSWGWMHLVGLVTAAALALALVRLGQLTLDGVAALRVKFEVDESRSADLDTKIGELVESLGIRRPVRAAVKPEAAVPMTLGGARPTILLPPELTKKTDALRTTLVHECVHIRRWDDLAYLIERVVGAVFFVHPLVAWLCEDIERAREWACDAAVLDDGYASASSYARLLAAFADGSDPQRLGALSLSESPSSLTDRIDAMRAPLSTLLSSRLGLTTTLTVVGAVLTLGIVACSDSMGPTGTELDGTSAAQDTSFMVVGDDPELIGGLEALQESVSYPEASRTAGVEGRVIVRFVVTKNGGVEKPEVVRGVNEQLNEAAIAAVKAQKFKPGEHDGEPVRVQMTLPVTFSLDGSDLPEVTTSHRDADEDDVFMVVEDQPELQGGMEALRESVHYPEMARKAGIEGQVIVQFVVNENGEVVNPTVVRGVHKMLNEAAIEAVRAQKFEPGRQRGEPVRVKMSLPVAFEKSDRGEFQSSAQSDAGSVGVPSHGTINVDHAPRVEELSGDASPSPYRPPRMRLKGGMEALQDAVEYPDFARKAGIEGRVVVAFAIDEAGTVTNPTIREGAHKMLNEAALDAIRRVSFEPVESVGGPTTTTLTLPINFELPNDDSPVSSQFSPSEDGNQKATYLPPAELDEVRAAQRVLRYPESAREAGLEGRVRVEVTVDGTGNVESARVQGHVPESLANAAVRAVKSARFPSLKLNAGVVPLVFSLPERGDENQTSNRSTSGGRSLEIADLNVTDQEISGRVLNANTDLPVAGATVEVPSLETAMATAPNGRFSIVNFSSVHSERLLISHARHGRRSVPLP